MSHARSRLLFLLAALALLGLPDRAAAQGGFLDWISKLSGPEIQSLGVSWDYCLTDEGCSRGRSRFFVTKPRNAWLIRGSIASSYSTSDTPEGSSGDVDLFQFSPTALYTWNKTQVELGIAFHRFSGDGFDSFWRHSLVTGFTFLPPLTDNVYLEIGPRLRYFPDSFEAQDFGGDAEPEGSGGEWVWGGQLAVGYRFGPRLRSSRGR
jgi:hypothetical protein